MNHHASLTRRIPALAAALLLVAAGARAADGDAPNARIGFYGFPPPAPFVRAAKTLGYAVTTDALPAEGPLPDMIVVLNQHQRLADEAVAGRLAAYVRDGGVLLVSAVSTAHNIAPVLDEVLPVNAWCYREAHRNLRGRVPLAVPPDAGEDHPFHALVADGRALSLTLDRYIDLHLPGAPVENSIARYMPEQMRKPVWNNDWRVLLETGLATRMPMLVEGRAGAGRAFIFGGEWQERTFIESPDVDALLEVLLPYALRDRAPEADPAKPAPTLAVDVATVAPNGGNDPAAALATVRQAGGEALPVVVSVKVAGMMRELIDARTFPAVVPADGVLTLTAGQLLPDPARAPETRYAAEKELPYRRITLGILSQDRRAVLAEHDALVGLFRPVHIRLAEAAAEHADLADAPVPFDLDNELRRRFVYASGTPVAFTLDVTNGLVNLAPLATAADLGYPGNWSTRGLNDLSYSVAEGRALAVQGGWSGKQAARQDIALTWPIPVTVAAHRIEGYGAFRNRQRANPTTLAVVGVGAGGAEAPLPVVLEAVDRGARPDVAALNAPDDPEPAVEGPREADRVTDAAYIFRPGGFRAHYDAMFARPAVVREVRLAMEDRDPELNTEPFHARKGRPDHPDEEAPKTNTSIQEWEVYGWPSATPPAAARGRLRVVATEAGGGRAVTLVDRPLALASYARHRETLTLPAGLDMETWRIDATFTPDDGAPPPPAEASIDALFVPAGAPRLERKAKDHTRHVGLLCSRGWVNYDSFGRGMQSRIHGWGGYDPEIWCWSNHLSETFLTRGPDPSSLFVIRGVPSHYTNPFKYTPAGEYAWDEMARVFEGWFAPGGREATRGVKHFIASGEDRWNGINVFVSAGWGEFVAFDLWLREQGRPGLRGRLWKDIADEIRDEYGRDWQLWHMHRYADAMLDAKAKFAEYGIDFTFYTHGSFPFAGGALGAKLAETHAGVGTDLFWELRKQDLIWSLGSRFAVVAANPDFRSSIYSQWGWVNSDANKWWFANNAQVEPARRQWYAAYFQGRIDQRGTFHPYHTMGFDQQGGYSTLMSPVDYMHFAKTAMTVVHLRPAVAAGYGLVVSWNRYEKMIPEKLGKAGFGLFGAPPSEDIEELFGHAYDKLSKSGVPLSFVANTDSLAGWSGTQPLVLVNGINFAADEIASVARLAAGGAPIIALGEMADDAAPEALAFFGVRRDDAGAVVALPGTETVALAASVGWTYPDDATVAYVLRPENGAARVWVAASPKALSYAAAAGLARGLASGWGPRLRLPLGVAATTFVAEGRLFVALTDHTDVGRRITVDIAPGDFLPALAGAKPRVVNIDTAEAVEAAADDDGRWSVTLAMPASDGRLLMFAPERP